MCVLVSPLDSFQPRVYTACAYVGVCSDMIVPVFAPRPPDWTMRFVRVSCRSLLCLSFWEFGGQKMTPCTSAVPPHLTQRTRRSNDSRPSASRGTVQNSGMHRRGGGSRSISGFVLSIVRAFIRLLQVGAGSDCIMQHAVVRVHMLRGVEGLGRSFPNSLPGQAAVGSPVPVSLPGYFRPAPVVEEFVNHIYHVSKGGLGVEVSSLTYGGAQSIRGARYGRGSVCCVRNVWWGRGRGRAILCCVR